MIDMIQLEFVFSVLSGILAFAFYISLFIKALKVQWSPNFTSWFIWALNDTLILFASLAAGARNTLAVPLVYGIFGWVIVLISLRDKASRPNRLEIICLILSVLSWISYFLPIEILTALILGVVVNTLGGIPTIARLWHKPLAEPLPTWLLIWMSGLLSVLSLEKYTIELGIFPICSLITTSLIVLVMIFRRKQVAT